MSKRGNRVRTELHRDYPQTQRPEINLRRAGDQRWALVDANGRTIVADESVFEPVRR